MTEEIKHWNGIDFAVWMIRENDNPYVNFKAYEIVGYGVNPSTILYHLENYTGSGDETETLDKAQVYLSGSIKWDGCSNMQFDEQENVMLHFCGKHNIEKLGTLLSRLYELAAEMMPEHAKDMG